MVMRRGSPEESFSIILSPRYPLSFMVVEPVKLLSPAAEQNPARRRENKVRRSDFFIFDLYSLSRLTWGQAYPSLSFKDAVILPLEFSVIFTEAPSSFFE